MFNHHALGFIELTEVGLTESATTYVRCSDVEEIIEITDDPDKATYWMVKIKGRKKPLVVDEALDEIFDEMDRVRPDLR